MPVMIEDHCIERAIAYHQEMGEAPFCDDACPYCDEGWVDDYSRGSVYFGRNLATRRRLPCEQCHGMALLTRSPVQVAHADLGMDGSRNQPEPEAPSPTTTKPAVTSHIGHLMFPGLPLGRYFIGVVVRA